jgi:hypothetical protein
MSMVLEMAANTRRMILPERVFGHVGDDPNALWPRDFADCSLDYANDLVFDRLAWGEAALERDVHFGYPSAHLIHDWHHRGFRELIDGEAGGFQFLRSETVPGHVDDVIDAAQDAVVAVSSLHCPNEDNGRFAEHFIHLLLGVKLCDALVRSTIWIQRI